ncbi:uncharacterized protein A4U43_C01F25010 [Asparagus officinalis]|uniref:DUF547 domain-containing protein n=1 Tax=Asparagus officinalis TaxID=4686 RepID=A0A5P1FW44_ASPOF|nr:uncharacterized protein A4U43_C01F25010 [Asparagus officinalis]
MYFIRFSLLYYILIFFLFSCRFLLGELAKVDPSTMNNDQKLAFWINLYNSLIMHAYLAYGVPRNDIKFFALMQKVSYTIRGQSFSPADIEFVILKMKPPPHHPQIALALAIHTFKISEEHRIYSIDAPRATFSVCPQLRDVFLSTEST